jgi:hypothetical protein
MFAHKKIEVVGALVEKHKVRWGLVKRRNRKKRGIICRGPRAMLAVEWLLVIRRRRVAFK